MQAYVQTGRAVKLRLHGISCIYAELGQGFQAGKGVGGSGLNYVSGLGIAPEK